MSAVELSEVEQIAIGKAFNEAVASIKKRKLHKNPNDPLFRAMPTYETIAEKFSTGEIKKRFSNISEPT